MRKKYNRILVVNIFGIGDVLFTAPLLRIIKKLMPESSIDYICNKRCQYILKNNKCIDDIIVFEKDDFREVLRKSKKQFIVKLVKFISTLKRKKYDLAIDLSLGYQIALLLKILGVKKRIGFNYRKRGRFLTDKLEVKGFNDKHVVEYYLDVLRLIGIDTVEDKYMKLVLTPELDGWANEFLRKKGLTEKLLIGFAPGGGKSWGEFAIYRRWDHENFAYVAEKLSKKYTEAVFLIFGSDEEKDICGYIKKRLGDRAIDLSGKLSLPESSALIKKCRLLLCNDGGLLHIAVSQSVSTVSVFGPVDDKVYGPYPQTERHRAAKAEGVECRPCYKSFKHVMCKGHECLKKIDKEKVLGMAEEILRLT